VSWPFVCLRNRFRFTRWKALVALIGLIFAVGPSISQADAPTVPAPITSKLLIAPSSSKLAGGTAKLIVGSLSRRGSTYVGDYRIRVFPYFFKNETGRLLIKVSETALRQMVSGGVTSFTGRATTNGSGLTRKITAQATPSGGGRGALTFAVTTENGPLVFNTSYLIAQP
jgi:hypothetical protein